MLLDVHCESALRTNRVVVTISSANRPHVVVFIIFLVQQQQLQLPREETPKSDEQRQNWTTGYYFPVRISPLKSLLSPDTVLE